MSSLGPVRFPVAIPLALATATATASASATPPDLAYAPVVVRIPASAPAPVATRLYVGVEVAARWFAYSDPLKIATNLRPYDAVGVPLLVFGGELRPLSWTRLPIVSKIGIAGEYAFAPYLTSSITGGKDLQTSFERGLLTLRIPVRLGHKKRAPVIAPRLGYESLVFEYQDAPELSASLPTTNYKILRIGVDATSRFWGPLVAFGSFEWLSPLEGGAVYDRFRDITVNGIDAQLGLGVHIAAGTEVRLSAGYTRFFSTFLPVPGDAYVAGGALDQFGGIKLGVNYVP